MKTDAKIKQDILDELARQSNLDETEIGVTVENGGVMLSGVVNEYSKKVVAEKAAKKIKGVKAIAEDVQVKFENTFKKTDQEIAKAIVNALERNSDVPEDKIYIEVDNGRVTLSGEVDWAYERNSAVEAVEKLFGVKQVCNNTCLKETLKLTEVENKIKKAFKGSTDLKAENIKISTDGYTVTLRGTVGFLKDKKKAETAVYKAPGVYQVKNELEVQFAQPSE